jgi:hypothetical protein
MSKRKLRAKRKPPPKRKLQLHEQFFAMARELAERFLRQLRNSGRTAETELQQAVLFFFSQAYKSLQAVELLCAQGFTEDAYRLARGIYELRLQAIYMGNKPDSRSKLFFDHWFVSWFGGLPILKREFPGRASELNQWEADIRMAAETLGRKLPQNVEDAAKSIKRKWWKRADGGSGSIASLLSDLDSEETQGRPEYSREYDVIYSRLSDYTHSGPRLFPDFSVLDWERSCRPDQRKKQKTAMFAWSVRQWLAQIILEAARAFQLGFDEEAEEAEKEALKLAGSKVWEL